MGAQMKSKLVLISVFLTTATLYAAELSKDGGTFPAQTIEELADEDQRLRAAFPALGSSPVWLVRNPLFVAKGGDLSRADRVATLLTSGTERARAFWTAVQSEVERAPMSPPKEILNTLITMGFAYGTTVGTFRDLVESTYPPLGWSVHLEDYAESALWLKTVIWSNLGLFHLLQMPTYYEVFEPFVRELLQNGCWRNPAEVLESAGTPGVKRGTRAFVIGDSLSDGATDLVRYVGNTLGLMRNMLTYPFFFAGMVAESIRDNQSLERKAIMYFPGYGEDTKEQRDALLRWMDLAYNAVFNSENSEELARLFVAYKARNMDNFLIILSEMVREERKQLTPDQATESHTGYLAGRVALQAATVFAVLPLWLANEYTLSKLVPNEIVTGILATGLTISRLPRAIQATGRAYDYMIGALSNYARERALGVRIPADYMESSPLRTAIGNGLYDAVLSLPMMMTFLTMGMDEDYEYDPSLLVLGSLLVLAVEAPSKHPLTQYFKQFRQRVFYGEKIESEIGNTDYYGLGGLYNAGVETLNLLRGYYWVTGEEDASAKTVGIEFVNWLAGKRLRVVEDSGIAARSFVGMANAIRHLSVENKIEYPMEEDSYWGIGWVVNRCVDAANFVFYRPTPTENDRQKNELLKFIRELSLRTGIAQEEILHQLTRMIDATLTTEEVEV